MRFQTRQDDTVGRARNGSVRASILRAGINRQLAALVLATVSLAAEPRAQVPAVLDDPDTTTCDTRPTPDVPITSGSYSRTPEPPQCATAALAGLQGSRRSVHWVSDSFPCVAGLHGGRRSAP
jgi:hypothetical protein